MKKMSDVRRRQMADRLSHQINQLGNSRILRNDLYMLNYHRDRCAKQPDIVADYDRQILKAKLVLEKCLALEAERAELYIPQ